MIYTPYYEGGWQSGEAGGTPITPEALNHTDKALQNLTMPVYFISGNNDGLYRYSDSKPATINEVVDAYFAGQAYFLRSDKVRTPHRIQGFTISSDGLTYTNVPIAGNYALMFCILSCTAEAFSVAMAKYMP